MLFRKMAAELFEGTDADGIRDGIERRVGGGMIATFDCVAMFETAALRDIDRI